MIIEHVKIKITKEEFYRLEEELCNRTYGNYRGLNIVLLTDMADNYYIKLADYIDKVIY